MIVFAWFTLVALIILAGFAMLGATFVHWYLESKRQRQALRKTQEVESIPL